MKSSSAFSDRNRSAVDEAKGQWLQSEERAKVLSEKLSSALADIINKDNLVKQHVKVAEEAVSGTFFFKILTMCFMHFSILSLEHPETYHVRKRVSKHSTWVVRLGESRSRSSVVESTAGCGSTAEIGY